MNSAEDIWKPLPKPHPEKLRLQMALLESWLQRPIITVQQAACLLAGVCPPERDNDDRLFGAYLPGRQEWEIEPDIGRNLLVNEIDELKTKLSEAKTPQVRSLADFLRLASELRERPSWLDFAVNDPECKKLLPVEFTNIPPDERPIQIANRKKALKKRDEDDKYKLIVGAGRAEFDRLQNIGFEGHKRKNGALNKATVARSILDAIRAAATGEPSSLIPAPRTVERHLTSWLGKDGSDSAPALSDGAGADVAK
ncbi:hypothetical protein [Roseobacter sp. S98]|uniref:hypothetical protein n=1 Tax=Roseobacter algicola (ex Choi et al. 2025) (nom. illeg.) TaxID=3092138 RepID=UPI0035C67C6D